MDANEAVEGEATGAGVIAFSLVEFDGEPDQGVDARELHERLGVATPFKDWIRRRIEDAMLMEDEDFYSDLSKSTDEFCCADLSGKNCDNRGGHNRKDYILSIDAAKHVAMLERTEIGRQVRAYFIRFEKEARNHLVRAAKVFVEMEGRLSKLEEQMAFESRAMAGVVANMEEFRGQPINSWYDLTEVAALLGGSRIEAYDLACAAGLVSRTSGRPTWKAQSKGICKEPENHYTAEMGSRTLYSPKAVRLMQRAHNG